MVKIKSLVLWSNNFEKKIIDFNLQGITLLIGNSKVGKTAIISIIDYCLASSECEIPVGIIRNKCSWFGVVLKINDSNILFARKSPKKKQNSDEMYFEVLENDNLPTYIDSNRTRDDIKNYFNDLFGITNLFLNNEFSNEYIPSYRDTLAINFFPQDLLLNKDFYFYKQHNNTHNQRFKYMFPYLMEIYSINDIMKKKDIEALEKKLRFLEKDKKRNENIIDRWEIECEEIVLKALEYGLLSCENLPEKFEDKVILLKLINKNDLMEIVCSNQKSLYMLNKEVQKYQNTLENLFSEIRILNRKINDIELHSSRISDINEYSGSIYTKKISEWLINDEYILNHLDTNKDSYSNTIYKSIVNTLIKEELDMNFYNSYKVSLDNEYLSLKQKLQNKQEELKITQSILKKFSEQNIELNDSKDYINKLYIFYGKLEKYLEVYDIITNTKTIDDEISELKNLIDSAKKSLNQNIINERYNEVELYTNGSLDTILDTLNVEHRQVDFNPKAIEFIFEVDGTKVKLPKIGSGSNYVEYHIAMALMIHIYIQNKVKNKCTFDFVVFDQPSEAYFPTDKENIELKEKTEEEIQNDITNLKALYRTISTIRKKHCSQLQVILFEHADEKYWKNQDEIFFDESIKILDWKETEEKLIPNSWDL